MKKKIAKYLLRILGLCDHEWNLRIDRKISKICKQCDRCGKLINTGI